MDSPLSARRIATIQTRVVSQSNTGSSSENGVSKTKQDRSVLIDITNDSPIVGLANANLETLISPFSKQRNNGCKMTPGSGEALLRGQVKNLLQMVEEEAAISKFSLQIDEYPISRNLKALMNSPSSLVAPTPANTPQLLNFSDMDVFQSLGSADCSPIEDELHVSKVILGDKNTIESSSSGCDNDTISRTLFLDSSEKSDSSSDCSSVVTYQGIQGKLATIEDDDDASVWSMQVNTSTQDENEDESILIDDDDDVNDDVYDEAELLLLEQLYEGISKMDVNERKFTGKHIKFVYNSDDELVEAKEESVTPLGKRLRFQDEEL